MEQAQYSQQVLDHFFNPRNVGEIADADGIGEVGNLRCGDVMYVYIRVGTRMKNQNAKIKSRKYGDESVLNPQPSLLPKGEGGSPRPAMTGEGQGEGSDIEEYIEDIKFKTLGCAAAIASTSMMTELVKGKSLEDAIKVTRDDINEALGVLPKQKYHCSILSADGIRKAIENYKNKQVST